MNLFSDEVEPSTNRARWEILPISRAHGQALSLVSWAQSFKGSDPNDQLLIDRNAQALSSLAQALSDNNSFITEGKKLLT
jgi:hypothetical protein